MDKKVKVRVIVNVAVEIHLDDNWGADCSLDQVYKQARESALNILMGSKVMVRHAKIIDSKVRSVIAEEQ